jgi:acyl-CoA reductase-like NAD-dependent aldehyde dehydrogenase
MTTTTLEQPGEIRFKTSLPSKLFIDGQLCDAASGRTFEVEDPATGETIAHMALGDREDIDRAIAAARRTFDAGTWWKKKYTERQEILWRWGDLIQRDLESFAELEVRDNGMPLALAKGMVASGLASIRFNAGAISKIYGHTAEISGAGLDLHAYTIKEPVGVAGLITPWNGPFASAATKVSSALAAGCSVVLKPAENTPLSAVRMAELALEAGIPAGVFNVVPGYGQTAGQALVEHRMVDVIHFTGSTDVGKHLVRTVADDLKRLHLELGGKSPVFIFDDADVDEAIPAAAMGIFRNSGQVCFAGSRLYVQDKVFDRVVAGISAFADGLKVGNGFAADTQLGPLVSGKQRERVLGYIESGRSEGARVTAGGQAVEGAGYFMHPTVFTDTSADMQIMREEIFGPVIGISRFAGMEDIAGLGNATPYGLGAGIYTRDLSTAHKAAKAIKAGNVWINAYGFTDKALPFGGYKQSGWGREGGFEGVEAFLEQKTVYAKL